MSEVKKYYKQILQRYRTGNATKEEQNFLDKYYNLFETNDDLISAENEHNYIELKDHLKSNIDQIIASQQLSVPKATIMKSIWPKYIAAAAIVLVFSLIGYFLTSNQPLNNQQTKTKVEIAPGGSKALLTLANGTKIILDDKSKGEIPTQSGIKITKTADGQVVYTVLDDQNKTNTDESEPVLNTISTPNGGQYTVVLTDGTKVMLNAASSLTFPSTFKGGERNVSLSGEAYFEVSKNKSKPFKVNSGMQVVEVLGTHFNVNAYNDEAIIKTTLIEGSVKVSTGNKALIIAPGQQTVVDKQSNGSIAKFDVNTDKEMAWKNGVFSFDHADLVTIMKQISRWYNVNIVYIGDFPDEEFFGEISRNSNLTEVFKILELNNIQCKVEGKTIKVQYKP